MALLPHYDLATVLVPIVSGSSGQLSDKRRLPRVIRNTRAKSDYAKTLPVPLIARQFPTKLYLCAIKSYVIDCALGKILLSRHPIRRKVLLKEGIELWPRRQAIM